MKKLLFKSFLIFALILAAGFIGKLIGGSPGNPIDQSNDGYTLERLSGQDLSGLNLENFSDPVKDDYQYFGLSGYLGNVLPVSIGEDGSAKHLNVKGEDSILVVEEWVGFRGRFETVLVRAPDAKVHINKQGLSLEWNAGVKPKLDKLTINHDEFKFAETDKTLPDVGRLQYIHLPKPLQYLCRLVEWIFKTLVGLSGIGWGFGIFLFALAMRLLMWPISSLTKKYQLAVNEHRANLNPIHAEIKKSLKGQQAHEALMKSYKDRGVSPYYTLKPLMITLIGLPVLIAIFNMLGEVNALNRSSFLWIDSLAYPDDFATLPFSIPVFGNRLNLLPFFMTIITIISAKLLTDKKLAAKDLDRQKRNLIGMAVLFFFLFYNFPSGMVLYWTLASTLALILSKN